jgi:hypothetical protein
MLVGKVHTTVWRTATTRKVTIKTSRNLLLAVNYASIEVSLDRKKPCS